MYIQVRRTEKKSKNMVPGLNIWFVLDFSEGDRRAVARWVTGGCGLKATFNVGKMEMDPT